MSMPLYRRAREERAADGLQVRRVRRRADVRPVAQEAADASSSEVMEIRQCAVLDWSSAAPSLVALLSRASAASGAGSRRRRLARRQPPGRRSNPRTPDGHPGSAGHLRPRDADAGRAAGRCSARPDADRRAGATARESRSPTAQELRRAPIDGDRAAPPIGGDGSAGAAGNVGGYNNFWIDPGSRYVTDRRRRSARRSSSIRRTAACPQLTAGGAAAQRRAADARPTSDRAGEAAIPGFERRRRLRRSRAASARRAVPARLRLDVRSAGAAELLLQQPASDRADARTRS